ncbi:MAG TPA: D-alanyl-D-alanine carboxypeptidase/D-alanyl-D-alanine-endopeptidase [Acidimicrobiales bacterium]|nr:D-alanyl-D-alanine carboxypeptidase/D-alanyl-D-alanine-endopeptidase [Acidimicrobiales bacterium]
MRLLKARAAPALVATAIVVLAFLAFRAEERDSRTLHPIAAARAHTSVLSARRVPELLVRTVGDGRVGKRLAETLADPAMGAAKSQTCVDVQQGSRPIYSQAATQRLLPASNLKLLTAAATLARLDGNEQLQTELLADRAPSNGVINGPLYLVGGGDPLIGSAAYETTRKYPPPKWTRVESIADAVVAAGVREIKGGVLGDDSRYDRERVISTWPPRYISLGDIGPMSALAVNDGFEAYAAQHVPSSAPARHAASVLTELLQARGVTVDGTAGEGRAPSGAVSVAHVPSMPVKDIVTEMLEESDNDTAELLVKELGHRFGGAGTTTAGLGVLHATLADAGLPMAGWTAVDGSGLDRADRATCRLLVDTLTNGPHAGEIVDALPVAAGNGTLAHRFVGHPAAGRLRGKTGSLDGVISLSGVVDSSVGRVSFALVMNQLPSEAVGLQFADAVGDILALYPDAPKPDEIAP